MVRAGLTVLPCRTIFGKTHADHWRRRREVCWEALRRCVLRRKVLSRGELEKNGFSTFDRAPDILYIGVFKNLKKSFLWPPGGGSQNRRTSEGPRNDF